MRERTRSSGSSSRAICCAADGNAVSTRRRGADPPAGGNRHRRASARDQRGSVTSDVRLHGDRVVLRPSTEQDLPRFASILQTPEVSAWWGLPSTPDALRHEMFADDIVTFAIEIDGATVGLIQCHEETTPGY